MFCLILLVIDNQNIMILYTNAHMLKLVKYRNMFYIFLHSIKQCSIFADVVTKVIISN